MKTHAAFLKIGVKLSGGLNNRNRTMTGSVHSSLRKAHDRLSPLGRAQPTVALALHFSNEKGMFWWAMPCTLALLVGELL